MTSPQSAASPSAAVWDEVVGQPRAVDVFRRAVDAAQGRLDDPRAFTNSWLITGPAGSGRSTCAYAFAAALLAGDDDRGETARQVAAHSHPDLTAVATETMQLDIRTARDLVEAASLSPMISRYRVIVVEDADRMVARTSNALLKAIEEPPSTTVWVLCAPSEADLLPTIRSRVRTVVLAVPTAEEVAALLERRHGVAHDVAVRAAREAQSHIGMATRLVTNADSWRRRDASLDGVLALADTGSAARKAAEWIAIAETDAKALAEDRDERERAELRRSLGLAEGRAVPREVRPMLRQLEEHQKKRARRGVVDGVDRILTDTQSLLRDVLMTGLGITGTLVNETRRDEIARAARERDAQHVLATIDAIETTRERIAANVTPILALEAFLIGWAIGR